MSAVSWEDRCHQVERERDALKQALAHAEGLDQIKEAEIYRCLHAEQALKEARARWQPIETGPKDGTFVIALDTKGGVGKVHWCERYNPHAWADEDGMFASVVTHWMPLPGLPIDLENNKGDSA